MWRKLSAGFLLLFIFLQASVFDTLAAQKEFDYKSPQFKAVASQFMCTCGCGEDHYECDPNTCAGTKEFKKDIVEMMNKGMDKDQIREYYVNIYGEEILTAPEKKGFSLVAWVLPFAVLGGAGTGVFFVIRKWVKRRAGQDDAEEVMGENNEVEEAILSSMIDEERKKYL